jgi:hypothetical protein
MMLRRPLAPAFCLFRKTITSEAVSSVGGLFHFKPSVRCRYWHFAAFQTQAPNGRYWTNNGQRAVRV